MPLASVGRMADTIQAHKRKVKEIDYGYAGDVDGIGATTIGMLLNNDLTPVFCAMTHDGLGQLLNTNADTIAAEIAIGMGKTFETTLYYCFEKKGVLGDVSDSESVIAQIDSKTYRSLLEQRKITDGMLPKLENCFHALKHDVAKGLYRRPFDGWSGCATIYYHNIITMDGTMLTEKALAFAEGN